MLKKTATKFNNVKSKTLEKSSTLNAGTQGKPSAEPEKPQYPLDATEMEIQKVNSFYKSSLEGKSEIFSVSKANQKKSYSEIGFESSNAQSSSPRSLHINYQQPQGLLDKETSKQIQYENVDSWLGHTDSVFCLNWLPNKQIISGSADGTIKRWNSDGNCLATLQVGSGVIGLGVFSNGQFISLQLDGTFKLWDYNFQCIVTWEEPKNSVFCFLALGNGNIISNVIGKIKHWNSKGEILAAWKSHDSNVSCFCVFPNGKFGSGAQDGTIKIWDSSGQCHATFETPNGSINCLVALSNKKFASGSANGTLTLWDSSGKFIASWQGHNSSINCLYMQPNGEFISGDSAGIFKQWDSNNNCLAAWKQTGGVLCMTGFSDGRIISGSQDNALKMWACEKFPVSEKIVAETENVAAEESLVPSPKLIPQSDSQTADKETFSNIKNKGTVSIQGKIITNSSQTSKNLSPFFALKDPLPEDKSLVSGINRSSHSYS